MTSQLLHRQLFVRLTLVWIIMSIIAGAFVYTRELGSLDEHVIGLADSESRVVIDRYGRDMLDPAKVDLEQYVRRSQGTVHGGSFIIIEIYDPGRGLVAEAVRSGSEPIEQEMDQYRHEMLMHTAADFRKLYVRDRLYVLSVVPLWIDGKIAGYFEGVYEVDLKTLQDIRSRILYSVLQVVAVIFVTSMALYPVILALNRQLVRRSADLYRANLGMIEILGNAIAKRDSDTNAHNYRVTLYSIRLGEVLGIGTQAMQGLIKGAFLHDVGKIGISDRILLKPDALTAEETVSMRAHVQHGVEIIGGYAWLSDAIPVVSGHHEKFDGSGFLKGLRGNEIPLIARIFAVCDVFDALTSRRPYKEAFPLDQSLQMILQLRGSHFDPAVVDAFMGFARILYAEIHDAGEDALKLRLQGYVETYFGVEGRHLRT